MQVYLSNESERKIRETAELNHISFNDMLENILGEWALNVQLLDQEAEKRELIDRYELHDMGTSFA